MFSSVIGTIVIVAVFLLGLFQLIELLRSAINKKG